MRGSSPCFGDPIERALSQHRAGVRWGADHGSFDESIATLLDKRENAAPDHRWSDIVSRGEYGRILDKYLSHFPREQLLVLFNDELTADPQALLDRFFEFVGVEPGHVPPDLGTRHLQGGTSRRVSSEAIEELKTQMDEGVWPNVDGGRRRELKGRSIGGSNTSGTSSRTSLARRSPTRPAPRSSVTFWRMPRFFASGSGWSRPGSRPIERMSLLRPPVSDEVLVAGHRPHLGQAARRRRRMPRLFEARLAQLPLRLQG